nr:glutamate receptor ionotropic, kainate 5-like [Cherax quadricarinatus]
MRGSRLLCVLLHVLLQETKTVYSEDAAAGSCWSAVQQEVHDSHPAPRDFLKMARFVADFAKVINVNEIYFCLTQEAGLPEREITYIFASTLTRHAIFFSQCDIPSMQRSRRPLDAAGGREKRIPRYLLHPAALHITSRRVLPLTLTTLLALHKKNPLDFHHIVLGVDLPGCQMQVNAKARWFQASYDMTTQEVFTEELFLFADERESLRVPVTRWVHQDHVNDLSILHQPSIGPEDFQQHVVNVITMENPPGVRKCVPGHTQASPRHLEDNVCLATYLVFGPHFEFFWICSAGVRMTEAGETGGETSGETGGETSGETEGETSHYEGYHIDILTTLANTLNFRVKLRILPPDTAQFGVDKGDGNYSGLVGALQTWEADVALAGFSLTRERYQVMDFSEPIDYTGMRLYIWSNSSQHMIGWDTYILSFQWGTWLAILVLLGTMAAGFMVIVWHQRDEDPHFSNGHNVLFILFSCLVQQGSWVLPRTTRLQAVLCMFWLSCVILYASYTARLTSVLAVSSTSLPFSSLEEAVNTAEWRIGLLRGTSTIETLQVSQGAHYQKLYQDLARNPDLLYSSDVEGIQRVLTQRKYAVFAESATLDYLLRGNCSVVEVPGNHLMDYLYLGFRKGLPYAPIINRELMKMSDVGVLDRIHQYWWGTPVACNSPTSYTELGFSNILTAFLVLLAGYVVSLLLLVVELCCRPAQTSHKYLATHLTPRNRAQELHYGSSSCFTMTKTTPLQDLNHGQVYTRSTSGLHQVYTMANQTTTLFPRTSPGVSSQSTNILKCEK